MSYRIAYVQFPNIAGQFPTKEKSYPVNCFRADIKVDDYVIVNLPNQKFSIKKAKVISVAFLNWDCKNNIVCLVSEFLREKGARAYLYQPSDGKIHTENDLRKFLIENKWKLEKPYSKTWRAFFFANNKKQSAIIMFRKNGIDFQIFPKIVIPDRSACGKIHASISIGKVARHGYYKSEVDLFEFTAKFGASFVKNTSQYDEFFKSKGQPRPRYSPPRDEMQDIYDTLSSGDGEDVYLNDGVWLCSDGSIRNW